MTHAEYLALQDDDEARWANEDAARQQEPAEPHEWRDEAIDTDARALSRADLRGRRDWGQW